MKIYRFILFLAFYGGPIVLLAQTAVTNHLIAAREYLVAGEELKARHELDSALILSPNNYEANLMMGDLYNSEKRYTRAIMNYDKAILANSSNADLYMKRAQMHRILKNHRIYILRDFDKAILLDRTNVDYYITKANYLASNINPESHKYDFAAASKTIGEAMIIDKGNPLLHFLKSKYLKGDEQFLSALVEIERAIALESDNDKYHAERGNINFTIGRYTSAFQDYNEAIALDSTAFNYYEYRGHIDLNLEHYSEAYDDYSKAIDMIIKEIAARKGRIESSDPLNISLRLALLYRGMSLVQDNRPYDGCDDFQRAFNMGESKARNYMRKYCY